jgi:hypothetical protein
LADLNEALLEVAPKKSKVVKKKWEKQNQLAFPKPMPVHVPLVSLQCSSKQ